MIFFDESGDDGDTYKSSQNFFVVAVYLNAVQYKKENFKLRKLLKYKKSELKWNKLNRDQKVIFIKYIESINYKIDIEFTDKSKLFVKYKELLKILLERNEIDKELILYKGEHLNKMLAIICREFKKKKINFKYREVQGDESLGVEICDMWAGYYNSFLNSSKNAKQS